MRRQYFLGIDLGSSSVKASLVDAETGKCAATTFYPEHEAPIIAVKSGWAEQDTDLWWENCKLCIKKVKEMANASIPASGRMNAMRRAQGPTAFITPRIPPARSS